MSNEIKPLLSDEEVLDMARKEASNWRVGNQSDALIGAEWTIRAVRAIYEADRAKWIALVQTLVDALGVTQHIWSCEDEGIVSGQPTKEDYLSARDKVDNALNLAAEHGITPSQP